MISRASLWSILGYSPPCCAASLKRGELSPVGLLCWPRLLHQVNPPARPSVRRFPRRHFPAAPTGQVLWAPWLVSQVSGHSKGQDVHSWACGGDTTWQCLEEMDARERCLPAPGRVQAGGLRAQGAVHTPRLVLWPVLLCGRESGLSFTHEEVGGGGSTRAEAGHT